MQKYQPFHFKFRPKKFSEVIGQDIICKSIQNCILLNKIHFAYLFSGSKGIGKTTLARLFSKILNCIKIYNGEPCLRCRFCKMFHDKSCVDFYEIDGASFSNLDSIKNFLDNIEFLPVLCKYKIYLIDEVHMLSKYSFNFLLKLLEEPPIHVKFILVTTELDKIPDTILSRCIHYKLNDIGEIDIKKNIFNILKKEEILFSEECIEMIAYKSNYSIRDALNITEQMISLSGNVKDLNMLNKMFGIIDIKKQVYLLFLINNKNYKQVGLFLYECDKIYINYFNLINDLFNLIHNIYLYKKFELVKINSDKLLFEIKRLSFLFSINFLKNIYMKFSNGIKNFKYFINFKICFEMIILDCCS